MLLGYPYNFSLFQGKKIVGHLRLIPLLGLWIQTLCVNEEGKLFGSLLLRYALNFCIKNNYKSLWSFVHKNNLPCLKILERVQKETGLKVSITEEDEQYLQVEYING